MTPIPAWIDDRLTPVDKLEVHRRGLRHPAISVFVIDGDRTLLQRRALGKYHTPGLWANACCTHPHWGEPPAACAVRRLREELGITGVRLREGPEIEYRAAVGDGLTEHECVTVFTVHGRPTVEPNPAEVMATQWIRLSHLQDEIAQTPDRFTPWLKIYLRDHALDIFGAAA
ncbi:MAG: isopentenyl-diphosphate Delta-isomerase [Pseudomonadota bacterium]